MKKMALPFFRFVMAQMICAILAVFSDEKIRLYSVRSNGLSVHHTRILPTWFDGKKVILKRKAGMELVYVDIPVSLLFNGETIVLCIYPWLLSLQIERSKSSLR